MSHCAENGASGPVPSGSSWYVPLGVPGVEARRALQLTGGRQVLATHVAPAEQRIPHPPQLSLFVRVSTSHPSAALPLQSAKFCGQVTGGASSVASRVLW